MIFERNDIDASRREGVPWQYPVSLPAKMPLAAARPVPRRLILAGTRR